MTPVVEVAEVAIDAADTASLGTPVSSQEGNINPTDRSEVNPQRSEVIEMNQDNSLEVIRHKIKIPRNKAPKKKHHKKGDNDSVSSVDVDRVSICSRSKQDSPVSCTSSHQSHDELSGVVLVAAQTCRNNDSPLTPESGYRSVVMENSSPKVTGGGESDMVTNSGDQFVRGVVDNSKLDECIHDSMKKETETCNETHDLSSSNNSTSQNNNSSSQQSCTSNSETSTDVDPCVNSSQNHHLTLMKTTSVFHDIYTSATTTTANNNNVTTSSSDEGVESLQSESTDGATSTVINDDSTETTVGENTLTYSDGGDVMIEDFVEVGHMFRSSNSRKTKREKVKSNSLETKKTTDVCDGKTDSVDSKVVAAPSKVSHTANKQSNSLEPQWDVK